MILDNERYNVVKLNSQGKEITVVMRGSFLKQVLRDGSVITWSVAA